jgi:methionine--tRNA ligase
MRRARPFYVTTPIYYANASPHVGHLFTSLLADVAARQRALAAQSNSVLRTAPAAPARDGVWLATGTDEHGQKVAAAAARAETSAEDWTARVAASFSALARAFHVRADVQTRTSASAVHAATVRWLWRRLAARGHIYAASHEGWYAAADEAFVAESATCTRAEFLERWWSSAAVGAAGGSASEAAAAREAASWLPGGLGARVAAETGAAVEWCAEDGFKFRLSSFREPLLAWLASGALAPAGERTAALVAYVASGEFRDLSVSRRADRVPWAIRVPGAPAHSVYVWLDALASYLTGARDARAPPPAPDFPDDGDPRALFPRWPADVHFCGKDILKFHAVVWPAFLLAAGLDLPARVVSHGHFTVNRAKMSKSVGNVVDPLALLFHDEAGAARAAAGALGGVRNPGGAGAGAGAGSARSGGPAGGGEASVPAPSAPPPLGPFSSDAIRYLLLREGRLDGDGEFNASLAEQRATRDCADTLGNLASRLLTPRFFPVDGLGCVGPAPLALPWRDLVSAGVAAENEGEATRVARLVDGGARGGAGAGAHLGGGAGAGAQVVPLRRDQLELLAAADVLRATADAAVDAGSPSASLAAVFALLHAANKVFTDSAPWKLVPPPALVAEWARARAAAQAPPRLADAQLALAALAYTQLETLRVAAILLLPTLPVVAPRLLAHLGLDAGAAAALTRGAGDGASEGHPLAQWGAARVGVARPHDFKVCTTEPIVLFRKAPALKK